MARTQELDNDFDPRHRVVGAVILVTIAVIVLPLILDEHPTFEIANGKPQESVAVENGETPSRIVVKTIVNGQAKPAPAASDAQPEAIPKKETSVAKAASGQPASTGNPAVVTKQNAVADDKKKELPKSKPTPVAKVNPANTKEITTPHWAVQVGTFSNAGNVRRLSTQLKEHGYSVMQKSVPLKQGTAVRVRVGPYSSRSSADKAQAAINKQIGIKGVVVAGP